VFIAVVSSFVQALITSLIGKRTWNTRFFASAVATGTLVPSTHFEDETPVS
jgi:hypothetical protein